MTRLKSGIISTVCILSLSGMAFAADVAVDANSSGVHVQVGQPKKTTVVEKEKVVVVKEKDKKDHGKHKGQKKKHDKDEKKDK